MLTEQRGQSSTLLVGSTALAAAAPQCEQNFEPRNIIPKQAGQATVASRAPQCSQLGASVRADAPHIGQFKVSAAMTCPASLLMRLREGS
jgi:hypothetical protein